MNSEYNIPRGFGIRVLFFLIMMMAVLPKAKSTDFMELLRMTNTHPAVQSALSSSSAAYSDIDQAKAANNLQVSAGVSSVGYSGQPGMENNPLSPHLSVSKVLYDHGRTDALVEGREAAYNSQLVQVMAVRESLNQQVLSFYSTALTNTKVVKVLDDEIAALSDLLQRVKTIAVIDSGRASEINQVSTRLSSVIASREMSYLGMQQALTQLSQLLNKDIDRVNELPELKKSGMLPASLAMAEDILHSNPTWIVARHRRDEAMASVKLASKWNRPKWSVELTLNSPRTHGEMEPFKAAMLQFSSDMSLWDGGAGAATLKGESSRLSAAEQELEATMRTLKQQLTQLWISLPLREQQINALAQQSESAKKTWRAGEIQFFAGQRPLTDLISFATDYYSSLASYEEQKVQYVVTQWQIVSALGKMSDLAKNANTLSGSSIPAPKKIPVSVAQTYNHKPSADNVTVTDDNEVAKFKQRVSQPGNEQSFTGNQPIADMNSTSLAVSEKKEGPLFSKAAIQSDAVNITSRNDSSTEIKPVSLAAQANNNVNQPSEPVAEINPVKIAVPETIVTQQSNTGTHSEPLVSNDNGKKTASQQILREWPW